MALWMPIFVPHVVDLERALFKILNMGSNFGRGGNELNGIS